MQEVFAHTNLIKITSLTCSTLGPPKKICVFTVTCQKNLGSVGRDSFFFIIAKTGNSRSRFRNPIPLSHFRNFR